MITVFTKLLGIALRHLLKSKVPARFAITWSAAVCIVHSNVPTLFAIM